MKVKDPLLDIAQKLEELALKDPYFVGAEALTPMSIFTAASS